VPLGARAVEEGGAVAVKHVGMHTRAQLRAQAALVVTVANVRLVWCLQLTRAANTAVVADLNHFAI